MMKRLILIVASLMIAVSTANAAFGIKSKGGDSETEKTEKADKEATKAEEKELTAEAAEAEAMERESSRTPEETIAGMKERKEKMVKLFENRPNAYDYVIVESFIAHVYKTTDLAMQNSDQLIDYYYRTVGCDSDGNPSDKVKLPSPFELIDLKERVVEEVEYAKQSTALSLAVAEFINSVNVLTKVKVIKTMLPATKLAGVLAEESVAQAKIFADIMKNVNEMRKK